MPDEFRSAVSDDAWVRALLEAERALAVATARAGLTPEVAPEVFAEQGVDAEELAREGRSAANPVEPLVRRLRERSPHVHHGATAQDVLDTAAALVSRSAVGSIRRELDAVAARCAALADEHRATVMPARTLLQQAVPTTFGLKAAGWLGGVLRSRRGLQPVPLHAQLGGAGGTLAAFGDRGIEVLEAFAAELGLQAPTLPWHARRIPVAQLAAALDVVAGWMGKIGHDVVLLAQTEVAEVREATGGASTTMPQKRNPAGSVVARACARGAHAAAAALVGGVADHEHERAAGAWQAEWRALSDALALTGGAVVAVRRMLEGLEVDAERMRANLARETLSEATRFAPEAREPEDYLGSTSAFIDRVLELYRSE